MIKKIVLSSFLLALASIGATYAQQTFTIKGKVHGNTANGTRVYLTKPNETGETRIDSTVIKNNTFTFKGKLDKPAMYRVFLTKGKGAEAKKPENWLASGFYVDAGTITYDGHIDSLPSYYYRPKQPNVKPTIKGSKAQDLADQLAASISKQRREINRLDEEYLTKYHLPSLDNIFNTAEGIALLQKMHPLEQEVDSIKMLFIKNNPQSVVAFDTARNFFYAMDLALTPTEIDEMIGFLAADWKGTPEFASLKAAADQAKRTAIGAQYLDGKILDKSGKEVTLSSIFPKDKKYILLEFWASWCGPCRGEIPHLKHSYQVWKDKGFDIVSISLDQKDADWRKAMDAEDMKWNQYNANGGFDSPIIQDYNIKGIPYALLVDSSGKIVRSGMRGASLDLALEELLK
ncbi:TlpA disulfide reductase family protein [Sphingobacterium psychroaquaticum]|uniref:Thioredoxin-like n=1 Tax=Sphingobacterium psychroaquaticum TaxID=561061 RepID=A0A1X7K2Q6_9SPHI|nr:TlpA disulfide reductase family protein [Sphingobacterium psychroaquaticum]SMG34851.1 Thioredoxin-like [Sphingobacterium psychroaquaticum]